MWSLAADIARGVSLELLDACRTHLTRVYSVSACPVTLTSVGR